MPKRNYKTAAYLAPLFDSIADEVLVVDKTYVVIGCNRACRVRYEKKHPEILAEGAHVSSIPKEVSTIISSSKIWERVFTDGEFFVTEQFGEGKDARYTSLRFVPIMSEDKKPTAAAVFVTDVTFIRRAEIDLIKSRITLQESQHIAKLTRWTLLSTTGVIDWDDTFYEVFGIDFKTLKTKERFLQCFTKESRAIFEQTVAMTLQEKKTEFSIDSEILTEQGIHRDVHTLGKVEYAKDGSATIIGVSNDVTESKEASRKLAERNTELENTKSAMLNVLEDIQSLEKKTAQKVQQLNAILSSMREALVAVDREMKIILINQAAGALFRIAPQEAIGKEFSEICRFYKDDKKLERIYPVKQALKDSTIVSFGIGDEVSIKDHVDKIIPVAVTVSSLLGEVDISAIVILRDITKEKEVDIAKTELISLASHQLRTPLSSVNWYSEMLLSGDAGPISEDQKIYLTEIYKGNQRMIDLVNALLNVSRIDLGKIMVEPEKVSIATIVEGVFADLAPLISDKKLKVTVKIPKKLSDYLGDKKIITIAMQNLVSNAMKYTPPKGSIITTVSAAEKGKTVGGHTLLRDSIILSVSDTGYGIPSKDQEKIFTKLYRADNVREKEANGNGLGLYLVKSMIESAGGKVWFVSTVGKGTTFHIALPAKGMQKRNGATVFT